MKTYLHSDSIAGVSRGLIHSDYPIEQLASSKSTRFQRGFARMAMHLIPDARDATLESSDAGLKILAASEHALAMPAAVLRRIYADDLHLHEPTVRFRYGETLEEPIMWVRAVVPAPKAELVVHDLIRRGAEIEEVDWLPPWPVICAKASLRKLLGYPVALCALCQGKAELEMRLSHYAPVPPEPGKAA